MSKFLRFVAWTLFIAAVLVGLARLTIIRWWQVPLGDPYLEASIAPTLRGGDWLLLWRATAPVAGKLVLCPEPKAPQRPVIGRLIGEHGDHLQFSGSGLKVARQTLETEGGCDPFLVRDPGTGREVQLGCRRETVGSETHLRGELNEALPKPSDADVNVPDGQIFLVSDNRQFPWDSREFGTVQRDTCTETVVFRLVSKDGFFDVPNRLMLIR